MDKELYLCGGLQSSGSTLVSWCFLQRADMDGILDARFDHLPQMPHSLNAPLAWCKFTVACFRFSEVQRYLEDEGYVVHPLLVVRDVRAVFNSLIRKVYGRNGVTADDPPLRLRLERFLEDWTTFRDRGWPILKYEQFVAEPERSLREPCEKLGLPWDESMVTWRKPVEQIADASWGNPTFMNTRSGGLLSTVAPELAKVGTKQIPPADLEWMERRFAEMNRATGYPEHIPSDAPADAEPRAVPRFENTRRYERLRRKHRFANAVAAARERLARMFHRPPIVPPAPATPSRSSARA